jgi:hypothetical protein
MPITLDTPIGRPPAELLSAIRQEVQLRDLALPVVEILPCVPNFTMGQSLFTAKPCWTYGSGSTPAYLALLENHGYTIDDTCLKLSFLGDSFPTDIVSNEYGESILDRFAGTVSNASADIMQMLNARNVGEGFRNLKNAGQEAGGVVGNIMGGAAGAAYGALNAVSNIASSVPGGSKLGAYISDILAGGRIDFPQLWRGSNFKPSYTITVRLYNPNPKDLGDTEKYIIGPIAAMLLLATPISQNGATYNWPYIHKIRCKGLFKLESAFMSSITVIKGGDQLQVAFNQRLGVVDVRLEFGSLFNTMIAMEGPDTSDRPTLRNYITELKNSRYTEDEPIDFVGTGTGGIQVDQTEAIQNTQYRTSDQSYAVSEDQAEKNSDVTNSIKEETN